MFRNVSVRVLALFILINYPVSCCHLLIKITNQLRIGVCYSGCRELHYQSSLFKDFAKHLSGCGNTETFFLLNNRDEAFECYI